MDPEIEKTGRAIFFARELEAALRRLGATGTGLGELTADARKILPESILRDLYHVIGIRNRAAHEAGGFPADVDFGAFEALCTQLLERLNRLCRMRSPSGADAPPPPIAPELEELENWKQEIAGRLRLAACLPLFNWLFFAALVAGALWKSLGALGLLLLQLLALPLLAEGWRGDVGIYWITGGGLWFGAYLFGAIAMHAAAENSVHKPRWWWYLPVMSWLYLARVWATRVRWMRLLVGLFGIWLDIWALIVLFRHDWWHFFTGMAAAYLIGLIAVVLWGRPAVAAAKPPVNGDAP